MTVFDDVHEFQTIAGNLRAQTPTVNTHPESISMAYAANDLRSAAGWAKRAATADPNREFRRIRLLLEEVSETIDAIIRGDVVETADGFADINYITNGGADDFGIPLDEVHAVVHATNLAKFPGGKKITDGAGKILKPEGWVGPTQDIKNILTGYGWKAETA